MLDGPLEWHYNGGMIQKVIKVGTSLAVVIPRSINEDFSVKAGDKVNISVDKKARKFVVGIEKPIKVKKELIDWADKFIAEYRPALEALSKEDQKIVKLTMGFVDKYRKDLENLSGK